MYQGRDEVMATPMSPDQLVRQFHKWGVQTIEPSGWKSHRRDPSHGSWGPVNGIGIHHTGDDAPDVRDQQVLWNGRSDLPGPLCSWGMRDDGKAVMISGGRSNHFGLGSAATLRKVQTEDYPGYQSEIKPTGGDTVDGNSHFYGQETMYSGGHSMTIEAYRSTVRACAAICDFYGWTAKSVIGHKEWTPRKIDPGSVKMYNLRKDVAACLLAGPGNWPAREPVLRSEVTAVRTSIKKFLSSGKRRPALRSSLLAADKQLAKVERR